MKKVILISIDAMRPDGFLQCKSPAVEALMEKCSYCLDTKTVWPSVTLPCHLSLFHSVPPQRHGTLTNTYMTPVRPVDGIFEQVHKSGKTAAMFYGWQTMREVCRPGSVAVSEYVYSRYRENVDTYLTDRALSFLASDKPDFLFLYLPETDDKGGHDVGWMSEEYLRRVAIAVENAQRVISAAGDEYTVIITADHGGHDRGHGADIPEDMTIPMLFYGHQFEAGKELHDLSILDIAPTIADVMEIPAPSEWEGRSLIK